MRRFSSRIGSVVLTAAICSAAQSCYTYIPAMNRESDGVYYNPSKDSDREQRARYYARNDEYYYQEDLSQQEYYYDDYADPEYLTPIEFAYWSTMPAKYRSDGEVKILNTYYNGYYADPTVPRINIALGYGFGCYGTGWSFGISFGNPAYCYPPYRVWPYGSYYASPWHPWYGFGYYPWNSSWYYPGPWGWNDPWYWGNPWYGPGPWGWNDRYWWHHGYNPGFPGSSGPINRPPAQRPPRRYAGDTAPEYTRRPISGTSNRPIGDPSQVRNPSGNDRRPASGVSTEGYNRRPTGNTSGSGSSIRVPGQASPSRNGNTSSSSGNVRRSGYENIRTTNSSSSSTQRRTYRPTSTTGSSRSYSRTGNNPNNSSSGYDYSASRANYNERPSSSSSSSSRSYSPPTSSSPSSSGTSSSGYTRR